MAWQEGKGGKGGKGKSRWSSWWGRDQSSQGPPAQDSYLATALARQRMSVGPPQKASGSLRVWPRSLRVT